MVKFGDSDDSAYSGYIYEVGVLAPDSIRLTVLRPVTGRSDTVSAPRKSEREFGPRKPNDPRNFPEWLLVRKQVDSLVWGIVGVVGVEPR
jgi:hypothetical protein